MLKPTGSVPEPITDLKAHPLSLEDEIEGFQQRSDEELKNLRDGIEGLPAIPPDLSAPRE
jgi:hypothetical protein